VPSPFPVRFLPSPLQNRASNRVGGQRVIFIDTFPTAPLRTARERFRLNPLASNLFRDGLSISNDVQYSFGVPHLAYLIVSDTKLPVPLRPVNGFPVLRSGALLSRNYYWHSVTIGLAPHRQSRVPSLRNVMKKKSDLGFPLMSLNEIASHRPVMRAYHERNVNS